MTHRHHGTWYGLRSSISAALTIKAATIGGLTRTTETFSGVEGNNNVYEQAFRACVQKLRYWEGESPADIRRARELLEELDSEPLPS